MNNVYDKINEFVEKERQNIVDDLMNIVRVNSVAEIGTGGYPFGENVHKCLLAITELFNKYGFNMEYNPQNGYAILKIDGKTDKTMGIFAHADVVPVDADDWIITPPFEPVIVENQIVGRGADDNKSGIIGALYGLMALREIGAFPKNGLTVFIGGNEEDGMRDIKGFLDKEKMPDISLVPDYQFPYSEGEKGIARIDCKSRHEFCDILDFCGGDAYNVILPSVTVKLKYNEELYNELEALGAAVEVRENVICYTQQGIGGHAAKPEGSESAAYRAAVVLCRLTALCENDKNILSCMVNTLYDCYGEGFGINGEDEFGKITVANGIVSMKDGKLSFGLDVRYGPAFRSENVSDSIAECISRYDFYTEVIRMSDGFVLEYDESIAKALVKACVSFADESRSRPVKTIGGTYARYLKNAYSIGTGLYYNVEKLGLSNNHGRAHQSDECIDIDGFIAGVKIISAAIYEVDRAVAEQ